MIVQEIFYAVQCDNCCQIAEDYNGFSYFISANSSNEKAMEAEYHKDGDKHYCPECHSFDDEDNLIIKIIDKV